MKNHLLHNRFLQNKNINCIFINIFINGCNTCENGIVEPGEICHQISQTKSVSVSPVDIASADINSDGSFDLVVGYSDGIGIFQNDGSGVFELDVEIQSSNDFVDLQNVKVFDVDNDLDLDIVCVENGFGLVFFINIDGVFSTSQVVTEQIFDLNIFTVNDIDEDLDDDIVAIIKGQNIDSLAIFLNDGAGQFQQSFTVEIGQNVADIVAKDIDVDGDIDLVTANQFSIPGAATVLTNNGDGSFSLQFLTSEAERLFGIQVEDINKDNIPEIIYTRANSFLSPNEPNSFFIFKNDNGFVFDK